MLVRSSAAGAVRSCTPPATTGVRVLLESGVARVLLLLSARVLVIAWPQDLKKRCSHHVAFVCCLGAIHQLSDVCTTHCVACNSRVFTALCTTCATRFAYYFATPVAADAAAHNHGIAATVAGAGCRLV